MIDRKRTLILYIPVIHEGYLKLLELRKDVGKIYLLDQKLVKGLSQYEPAITALSPKKIKFLLNNLGHDNIDIISWRKITNLKNDRLLLVDDQLGRTLAEKYFAEADIEFVSVFLRWDRDKIFADQGFKGSNTDVLTHQQLIAQAYQQAAHSGDWWRQVGGIIVKDNQVLVTAYNRGLPDDHTPYQEGEVRDYLKAGEKPELANTIHAEQWLIAQAARDGVELKGADLYITHFPCPVCAKLIAVAQLSHCYFAEGSASLDGLTVMKSAGVKVVQVKGGSHAKDENNTQR